MMAKIKKVVRTYTSRVVGGVVGPLAGWFGVPDAMASEAKMAAAGVVTFVVYGIVHKVLDALGINPEDTATGETDA